MKTSTLLRCHRALTKLKYQSLFAPAAVAWPQGALHKLIAAGRSASQSPLRLSRIAQQIAFTFGVEINDVVRRILAQCIGPSLASTALHG